MKADLVWWEAVYSDGTIRREADGLQYFRDMPRENLVEFRLTYEGQPLFATRAPEGADGYSLRYRRQIDTHDRHTTFKVGWVPHGPVFAIDPEKIDADEPGIWVADRFHTGGGDTACIICRQWHPEGVFDPPMTEKEEVRT